MKQYLNFLDKVLTKGVERSDRTGVGTKSIFGHQMRFDLENSFPLLTTKKLHIKSIIHELLWFLQGNTNIKYLNDNGVKIWNAWADKDGNLGPVYGKQWRSWGTANGSQIDQISRLITSIKNNANSRRLLVNAWNVGELNDMALPPCHILFQFYVYDGKLSCQLYQRSADVFLGVPFNIASYSLLTCMVAQQCNLVPHEFIWTGGDCHIYLNHLEQVKLQLGREILSPPTLKILKHPENIFSYEYDDFMIKDYKSHQTIKAPIAV